MLLGACQKEKSFTNKLAGTITGAEDKVLYLENISLGKGQVVDSVKLDEQGHFSFGFDKTSYPKFYRLRLADKSIYLTTDSLDLELNATADLEKSYSFEKPSQVNEEIKSLLDLKDSVNIQIDSLILAHKDGQMSFAKMQEAINLKAQELKDKICKEYIYKNAQSPASYMALFLQKDNAFYFTVEQADCLNAYRAVATAYKTFYSEAPYITSLENLAMQAIAYKKLRENEVELAKKIEQDGVKTINYLDLELKGKGNKLYKLSDCVKGKDVLLSFTTYLAPWSDELVGVLRQVKQKNPNLEIYEVSGDQDLFVYKNKVANLDWITVHDPSLESFRLYNIQALPTFYLLKGDNLKRVEDLADLLK